MFNALSAVSVALVALLADPSFLALVGSGGIYFTIALNLINIYLRFHTSEPVAIKPKPEPKPKLIRKSTFWDEVKKMEMGSDAPWKDDGKPKAHKSALDIWDESFKTDRKF